MEKNAKIYVAGHKGLVGSAILKQLNIRGYANIITRTHKELDLVDGGEVRKFFEKESPDYVFLAAAKVGGIAANNKYRGEFIYKNLMIQSNVIHNSYLNKVKKLLFLGSTCIYPKDCPQPMKEKYLLTGELEFTNEPYAIAKIAGIKMCESYNLQYGTNFLTVMPTNLYGPEDNFDLETSHVLPALLRKMHLGRMLEQGNWEAIADDLNRRPIEGIDGSQGKMDIIKILKKYGINLIENKFINSEEQNTVSTEVWGSGQPLREFLWSEELADAGIFLMENRNFKDVISLEDNKDHLNAIKNSHINIGTGRGISIAHLAEIIKVIIRFKGEIHFNKNRPDGTPRKISDVTKLHQLGWQYSVELDEGIYRLYKWYMSSIYNLVAK